MCSYLKYALTIILTSSILLISGCSSEKTVPVKLTVILPDDLTIGENESLDVGFAPVDKSMKPGSGHIKGTERSCDVKTGRLNGLTPGDYKVTVNQSPAPGITPSEMKNRRAEFMSRFQMATNGMPFTMTPDPGQTITLDMNKQKISASK